MKKISHKAVSAPRSRFGRKSGFTFIEVIVTVAILAILFTTLFVAIDPVRRINQSRNARRTRDIASIAQAISLALADVKGAGKSVRQELPFVVSLQTAPSSWHIIGSCSNANMEFCGPTSVTNTSCLSLDPLVTIGSLPKMPVDPASGTAENTRYAVRLHDGRYEVRACQSNPEGPGGTGTPPLLETFAQ